MMKQYQEAENKLTVRQKCVTIISTVSFAVIGAVLGVIAYYQQWLG